MTWHRAQGFARTVLTTALTGLAACAGTLEASSPAVYYFSDCQTGAAPNCVPGNNANAGTQPAAPKRNLDGFDLNRLPAGTTLLFARGGAWANFRLRISNLQVTPAAPLVFDAYGSGGPPLFQTPSGIAIEFGKYQDTNADGGYTLRNLRLDGQGTADWGLWLRENLRYVTVDNVEITGFAIAIHAQSLPPHGVTKVAIRNSTISRNRSMGVLGQFSDSVIEGNTFEANNFSGSVFNHAIYLSGSAHGGRNNVVRNNAFVNNSAVNGTCTGGNVTMHGQMDGLLIEGNVMTQAASAITCYGFSITPGYDTPEWFRNVVVRGNTIVNLGGCAICAGAAPGIVVEDNVIVQTNPTYQRAILIPANVKPGSAISAGDDQDTGAVVRNNSIFLARPNAHSVGVSSLQGRNLQVVSNLVYLGAGDGGACFDHGPLSSHAAFDNNLCYSAAGNGAWSTAHRTLGAARSAGFDARGIGSDPRILGVPSGTTRWRCRLDAASPALNAGHAELSSVRARSRPRPDIGACERDAG
jgi:hypothetical protein